VASLRTVWPAVVLVIGLAGCGSDGTEVVSGDPLMDVLAAADDRPMPSMLIGQWAVEGPAAAPGTVVNLGAGDVEILLSCGQISGSFEARPGGAFVADVFSGSEACLPDDVAKWTPAWLSGATAFVGNGEGRLLLDTTGQPVATLSPGPERPKLPATVADSAADPPVVAAEQRARMDVEPAALPPSLPPATPGELLGMWLRPGRPPKENPIQPWVEFLQSREYRDYDGCNESSGGRWSLVGGQILATTGISTLAGCGGEWLLGGAVSAAFDGDVLVFLDEQGAEVRRLVRAGF
jgi:hypothetical protein